MSLRGVRGLLLGVHLFAALGIFGYVYGTVPQDMARLGFVPLLTLTGLARWQQARVRRLVRRLVRRRRAST